MDRTPPPSESECEPPLKRHKRRRLNSMEEMADPETYDGMSYQFVEKLPLSDSGSESFACASARASLEPTVTRDNYQYLRTYHPALSGLHDVSIAFRPTGFQFWVVFFICDLTDTHAGGLEIHVMPRLQYISPNPPRPIVGSRPDRLDQSLRPRKLLTSHEMHSLRETFPLACGVQIWIAGRLTVLFPDKAAMQEDVESHHGIFLSRAGGLQVSYEVLNLAPSTQSVHAGTAVYPMGLYGLGCCAIGLRLRLPDHDASVITTVTQGFVSQPPKTSLLAKVASTITTALRFLKGNRRRKLFPPIVHSDQSGNSSVGKLVFSALTKESIGRVTSSYDRPSTWLPYPAGYSHDLSLISAEPGKHLPQILPAPGMPPITGWGNIEEVLAGTYPLFMTSLKMRGSWKSSEWTTYEGLTDVNQDLRRSQVEGMQYVWGKDLYLDPKVAILWRNVLGPHDLLSAEGFSGSVLCQGRPTDKEVKALAFQNFQLRVMPHIENTAEWAHASIKGGFLLPDEVLQSTIECTDPEAEERPSGTWPRPQASTTEPQRRYVSDSTA